MEIWLLAIRISLGGCNQENNVPSLHIRRHQISFSLHFKAQYWNKYILIFFYIVFTLPPTFFEMDTIFKSVASRELLTFINSLKLNSYFMTWSKLLEKINNLLPDLNEKLSKECRIFLPVFRVYKPYAHLKLTITSRIRYWLADVGHFFPS